MTSTHLPLPPRKNNTPGSNGNPGLYWNKFFNQWSSDFSKVIEPWQDKKNETTTTYHGGKMSWVLSQIHGALPDNQQFKTSQSAHDSKTTGQKDQLEKAAARIADLAKTCLGDTKSFTTQSPFVTGMGLSHPVENGFLFHHTLGVPYLPGSSVKGMIRAWAEHWAGTDKKEDKDKHKETIFNLFGKNAEEGGPTVGSIIVFDALPTEPVQLYAEVITPHDGGWRIAETPQDNPPADWISPNPIPFLAVSEGTNFQFALAPRKNNDDSARNDLENAWKYLEQALEWIGAGAKTATGFGRFESDEKILERNKDEREQQKKLLEEQKQLEKTRPPRVGERANHDMWGVVEIQSIHGDQATIYSIDEADTVTVSLAELSRIS
jgi:CRISPR-associated protein Cmr6